MKKGREKLVIFSIAVAIVLLAGIFTYNYSQKGVLYSPDSSLKLYLKFDEGSGNVASDSSGLGNKGTIYGANWITGKSGNALQLGESTNSYVIVLDKGAFNSNSFSVSAWVNLNSYPTAEWRRIIGKSNFDFTNNNGWDIAIINEAGVPKLNARLGGQDYLQIMYPKLSINEWHLVTLTYDGQKAKLYIDDGVGVQRNFDSNQRGQICIECNEKFAVYNIVKTIPTNTLPVMIGRSYGSSGKVTNTKIDEVRYYNRALTSEEIKNFISEIPKSNCNQNKFKFAFVLLGRNQGDITQSKINKLNEIKTKFKTDFEYATGNLATVDVSYPVKTIIDDGTLINSEINQAHHWNVLRRFYKDNPDDFDFVAMYTTFDDPISWIFSGLVNNNVQGIGQEIRNLKDVGTSGKLKSLLYMNLIDYAELNPNTRRSYHLLHEMGHHWCCYVGDGYLSDPANNLPILFSQQYRIHWAPTFIVDNLGLNQEDPMNGHSFSSYWEDNQDGTYSRKEINPKVQKYNSLTLYLMGLIPKEEVQPVKLIIPDMGGVSIPFEILIGQFNEPVKSSYKYITIKDIISRYGNRTCLNI